jgi:hypothetical protein
MTHTNVLDRHTLKRPMGRAGEPASEGRTELVSHLREQVESAAPDRQKRRKIAHPQYGRSKTPVGSAAIAATL